MSDSAVKVAVRVRPFNSREEQEGAELCVEMSGQRTRIFNKETGTEREFIFDYSYWSHDAFKASPEGISVKDSPSSPYADQQMVFNDLGVGVLNNAWEGYHCCLFAYGQTGAGKSYSMVGYSANKGIIPIACEEIFRRIKESKNPLIEYRVSCSMLEIYNEQIQDLLQDPAKRVKGGLRVREDPKKGVFVDNLVMEPVTSYENISAVLDKGSKHRTVAATQMNATSSRAHTVLTINFTQVFYDENTSQALNRKESNINLVDLAGSERAGKTGATGDRLQEGANINKSLSTLGKVITALAKKSGGQLGRGEVIPYRESKLTRILQNALGGNSKTTMIAAISPALFNFDETLSTLRYADQVKSIKNQAVVNETPQEKLIRELKEENERLMSMIQGGGGGVGGAADIPDAERLEYEKLIEQLQREKEAAEMTWQQQAEIRGSQNRVVVEADEPQGPYITNLNEDPLLSGQIRHEFHEGNNRLGKKNPAGMPEVVIEGLGIGVDHCRVTCSQGKFTLIPSEDSSLRTMHNGKTILQPVELSHNDRIKFGNYNFFIFKDPAAPDDPAFDWEFAMKEANQEQVDGLLGGQDEVQAEMKRQLQAEMDADRQRLEEEKAKLKKQLESDDSINQKALAEQEEAIRLKEKALEEEYKKKQAIIRESEQNLLALEKLRKLLTYAIQQIDEANARAEELGKTVRFNPELYQETGPGPKNSLKNTNVRVRVHYPNVSEDIQVTWSLDKLDARLVDMQELFNNYEGEGELEYDPFTENVESMESTLQLIGSSYIYLDIIYHLLTVDLGFIPIIDERGTPKGHIKVGIEPEVKNMSFEEYETLKELVGQDLDLKITILEAKDIPENFSTDVYASYSLETLGEQTFKTEQCKASTVNPRFNYSHTHTVKITDEASEDIMNNALCIKVFGDMSAKKKEEELKKFKEQMQKSASKNDSFVSAKQMIEAGATAEELKKAIKDREKEIERIRAEMIKKEESVARKEKEVEMKGLNQTPIVRKGCCTCRLF